ncbi:uncharacterized protein LOC128218858 [Mya arenaria]|uniref:uncharacterized protein LOC128218858 n=1 Tax=Mya arenaria TaxID=6604 RepID=UPI0022E31171|nr:uncharacterized protein LOC128218858 [Mya arenaria]
MADRYGSCRIPICNVRCSNGGTCVRPDTCQCLHAYDDGRFCTKLQCSHLLPCFPGACTSSNSCQCYNGWTGSRCLNFESGKNMPTLLSCDVTLRDDRRTDLKEFFYFNAPCGTTNKPVWSNQENFNYVDFQLQGMYSVSATTYPEENYVSKFGFGIVSGSAHIIHSKVNKDPRGYALIALNKIARCSQVSNTNPILNLDCTLVERDYVYSIEHGDNFTVIFSIQSGGFRDLHDINYNRFYKTEIYQGHTVTKMVEFKFDFVAPKHCSEEDSGVHCVAGEEPIIIYNDITRNHITPKWAGWSDDLSGLLYYKLEVFKLSPNVHEELVELEPLAPLFNYTESNIERPSFPTITPPETGMYSVLLTTADLANNTKIARRLVLYDNSSVITITKPGLFAKMPGFQDIEQMNLGDGGLYIISAIKETGYMWQTSVNDTKTVLKIRWDNHFVNNLHNDGRLLNKVLPYPTQFQELEDDGILRSKKYVAIDDNDGDRTLAAIPNKHGIVKFELNRVYTDDKEIPKTPWTNLPLEENYVVTESLDDGSHVRVWLRATDIMNNTAVDYTEVHVDNTPPRFSNERLEENIRNGTFTYTSKITFDASDEGSGVHKLQLTLFVGNSTTAKKVHAVQANRNNETGACDKDPSCNCVLDVCYRPPQAVEFDNCWFIVPKEDLNKSGIVEVTIFNQALLTRKFNMTITQLNHLMGLEEYSGPTNIRIDEKLSSGVRITWDIPEKASCYGSVDITLVVYLSKGLTRVIQVSSEQTSVDILGLDSDQEYSVSLNVGYEGTELAALPYTFKTAEEGNHLQGGVIAAIIVSVLVIVGILVAIFVVLLRRGHMKPVRRGMTAVSVTYRKTMAGRHNARKDLKSYSNSMYVYGDMEFSDVDTWKLDRDHVSLQSLLTSGSFADIFKATIKGKDSPAVAKILRKGFTEQDVHLMNAKINFFSTVVGKHENVIAFLGAVTDDTMMGPFILYGYCVNGQLSDFLQTLKKNLTVETHEMLYRFSIGVARGMEFLAERKIVHRRLAARNIFLDNEFDVKIAGFGPLKVDLKDDTSKRERIPMKWMAPECLKSTQEATDKSDAWSYGVVLWEIFSLGDAPYEAVRGKELPSQLKNGYRLPKPEQCDNKWYDVMTRCWQTKPEQRPSFKAIREELDEIFVTAPQDDYYYYKK